MQGGSRDPATPWFDAAQERVPDSPGGRLDPDHPIRKALRSVAYPASREDISALVSADRDVTPAQAAWLRSSLPDGAFGSERDVVVALGRWGPPPPGVEGPL